MKNFLQLGQVLTYAEPSNGTKRNSGDVVKVGDSVGIAVTDIQTGGEGELLMDGVVSVDKVSGSAWSLGDKLDWDASNNAFGKGITSATGDVLGCAIAAQSAASGDTSGYVKLQNPGTGQ